MVPIWWISLQHDWADGLEAGEKVWVSAHHLNYKTLHSYLTKDGGTDEMFSSSLAFPKVLQVTHTPSKTSSKFVAPSVQHRNLTPHMPFSADITGSGDLGVVTSGKEALVFESRSGAVRRVMSGHVADVECVKFFPSDLVLLTGGSDMCLKIWSVEDGSCPVTLTGHKRPISSLAMIDRGKHVVSSSLDGTVKVWSCGTQECIATLEPGSGKVNTVQVFSDESGAVCVASASELGSLTLHSLQDNSQLAKFQHTSELTTCSAVSQHYLVAGSCEGEIVTVDVRNMVQPLTVHKRSNYAVSAITKDSTTSRVWCALRDGETFSLLPSVSDSPDTITSTDTTLTPDTTLNCDTTLSAGDCEPICSVAAKNNVVITSAKDRVVRVYDV